jgi:hypothetical protein
MKIFVAGLILVFLDFNMKSFGQKNQQLKWKG